MEFDLWYTERHDDKFGITIKVKETLYHDKSEFQTIDIINTEGFGRMLLLDGLVMTTEQDEFVYHEMISHIPMLNHPNPEQVLVIGGGDGGTIREVLKHPSVNVKAALKPGGIVVAQSESPIADKREISLMYALLRKVFPIVKPYVGPIPTYPGGYWSWAYCSVDVNPFDRINDTLAVQIEKTTKYYNRDIHKAAFALPNFVKQLTQEKD